MKTTFTFGLQTLWRGDMLIPTEREKPEPTDEKLKTMNTKQEQIKKLTAGRDKHLIAWLSLEDWDTLPTEDQIDEINEAWDAYGDDTDGFTRIVRFLMDENTVTAKEVYDDLLRDPEARRKIVSYDYAEYEDGEYGFVTALEDKYDVYGPIIYDAMSEIRLQFRRNF